MLSLTMFEAFETPIGARETDRTWRGMVSRARREFFARLMPIWAGVLTLATLVVGLPGLYLLGQATGMASSETTQLALTQGPLAGSFGVLTQWLQPLAASLTPTANRFGLEAFLVGMALILVLALLVRAAGARQWYQSVYDDLPRRRLILTGLLWIAIPLIVAFLILFFGALIDAVAESPAIVSVMVVLVSIVMLSVALTLIYLTFSVREPAVPSVLLGAGLASALLFAAVLILEFIPGLRSASQVETSPFRALITLSLFFFVFWCIFLAGSQLAVALARRRDPIERFNNASRGEQLDFALSLIRDVEDQTRSRRWAATKDLALTLAAPTAMVTFALDRLRRSGLVEHAADGTRPPQRWAIKDDLESLTLHDLSRAMGTSLEPSPGLHGRSSEDIIRDLAEREHLGQTQNLLSLFRDAPALPPVGEPMLAVADVDYRLDEQDQFASSQDFQPTAQVVDRLTGDNGGPVEAEEGFVFVDSVVEEDIVLDIHAGPSALFDQDAEIADGDAIALDLTKAMRVLPPVEGPDFAEPDASEGPLIVSGVAALEPEEEAVGLEDPAALSLGDASPLAAVQEEIDHLLESPAPVLAPPALTPDFIDPAGSWKGRRAPLRNAAFDVPPPLPVSESTPDDTKATANREWLAPLPAKRSWRRENARPVPAQSWKRGPAEDQVHVPVAPLPASIEPSHRVTFGSK